MSDKSLPKPVPPKDPLSKASDKPQMPPSARVQSSASTTMLSTKKPMTTTVPLSTKPSSLPPTMKPSIGAVKPAQLPGAKQSTPTPLPTSSPAAPAAKKTLPVSKSPQKKTKPSFAKVKSSPFKYLPFLIGGVVLIAIVWFVIGKFLNNKTQSVAPAVTDNSASVRKTVPSEQVTLIYSGLWEPDNVMEEAFAEFEKENPGVKIKYSVQSHKDYRERLQTAIASGDGPDIFRYHASWTPMLSNELSSMPQSIMSAAQYQETFYPVAAKMLSLEGQIVGIPLMYDGLALYFNKEMLDAADSEPPSTWAEVKILANKLTVRDGGKIKRGGIAIGNASNVEHFADILGLLMIQNGADLTDPSSKESQDALSFYTNFVSEDEVWDDKLPSSTVAFAREDVAMMLAPSWRAHEIKLINPNLDFGIVPAPRLSEERLAWASFWAEGVSKNSKNKTKAWELLKFLSSSQIQQNLHSAQNETRSFGEIYSRVDLANNLTDPNISAFLVDAPVASGWYLSSYTHDNGINDLIIKYYQDAINAVLAGEDVKKSLEIVAQGTQQTLRQYGVK